MVLGILLMCTLLIYSNKTLNTVYIVLVYIIVDTSVVFASVTLSLYTNTRDT